MKQSARYAWPSKRRFRVVESLEDRSRNPAMDDHVTVSNSNFGTVCNAAGENSGGTFRVSK